MTAYEGRAPTLEVDYRLSEARPIALDPAAFDIGGYLAKGAEVFDASGGSSFTFRYDPDGGPMKGQAAAAKKILPTP